MKVGLYGAGAVGSSFLTLGQKAGEEISVIGKGEYKERLEKGLVVNGEELIFPLAKDGEKFDLIFISVKAISFNQALEDLKDHVGKDTIFVSLLNGVSTEEEIKKKYDNPVVHSVARGFFASDGRNRSFDKDRISLTVGEEDGNGPSVDQVESFLKKIDYKVIRADNILHNIWKKFSMNVSENLLAAAMEMTYGEMKNRNIIAAIRLIQEEVLRVANAMGVPLTPGDIDDNISALMGEVDHGKTSTLQDIQGGRETEVDLFAGEMIRKGKVLGIPTPYSELLYYLVKGKEENQRN